jgi:hypothetical protein
MQHLHLDAEAAGKREGGGDTGFRRAALVDR